MGFDFPGYLAVWLFRLHQPEQAFWETMNPYRLTLLLDALEPPKKQEPQSLSEYLSGGA